MTKCGVAVSPVEGEYHPFRLGASNALFASEAGSGAEVYADGNVETFDTYSLRRFDKLRTGECFVRGETSKNITGTTIWQVMRGLVRARKFMSTLQVDEGFAHIALIEPMLGGLSAKMAARMEIEVRLLRAVGLALQDDFLGALYLTQSDGGRLREHSGRGAAPTICRLASWRMRDLDSFFALARRRTRWASGGQEAICTVFDLTIEAAVELDQLRLSSARHLAQDALDLAMTAFPRRPAIAALPASLLAQLLYEQGSLEDAEELIRTRLPAIRTGGSIESALRAYPLLARIAARHGQRDYASAILKEAEDLAEQRGWNRLSAVIVAERASLLLDDGQVDEALACADALQRLAESGEVEASSSAFDIHRIRVLVQARATLARTPSRSALDALRRLQHEAVRRREHYDALVLDIRLVEALAVVGEEAEALAVLIRALSFGSAVGVYQAFLDGGPRVETLLMRVYESTRMADDGPRELLPYLGSLVERRRAREIAPPLAPSKPLSGRILSERERNIVFWVSRGLSNKGIAKKLGITPETVKSHAKNIFIKLAVKTRAEAVSRAGDLGLM